MEENDAQHAPTKRALPPLQRTAAILHLLQRPGVRLALCDVVKVFTQNTLEKEPLVSWLLPLDEVLTAASVVSLREPLSENLMERLPDELRYVLRKAWQLRLNRKPAELGCADAAPRLQNVKGVSPKKLHEVARMTALLRVLAHSTGAHGVIDIGAGSGYLGLALAQPDVVQSESSGDKEHISGTSVAPPCDSGRLAVIGVEGSPLIHQGAGQRQQRPHLAPYNHRMATMHGRLEPGDSEGSRTVCNAALAELARLVQPPHQDFDQTPGTPTTTSPRSGLRLPAATAAGAATAVVTGVHACGNLTPSILRAFASDSRLRALACVGCCYQGLYLSEDAAKGGCCSSDAALGFPLSHGVRQTLAGLGPGANPIDRNALWRAASHQPRLDETAATEAGRVRATLLRAALELALMRVPHLRVEDIKGRVPPGLMARLSSHGEIAGAAEAVDTYVDHVLRLATVHDTEAGTEAPAAECGRLRHAIRQALEEALQREPQLRALLRLQALMEALVEDVLAFDRCLFLRQTLDDDAVVRLVPLFDEAQSPRCYAIVAARPPMASPLPAFKGVIEV